MEPHYIPNLSLFSCRKSYAKPSYLPNLTVLNSLKPQKHHQTRESKASHVGDFDSSVRLQSDRIQKFLSDSIR